MAFPPQFIDELRTRTGLADVVGRKVKLTRRGREFVGLCPFHNENTPSFTLNEEKGFFHCFGCGAHGDAIGFVMRADGLSFPEAVERLAAEAGLAVPVATPEEREKAKTRATLYQVVEAAAVWFEARLGASAGQAARDYLTGRGLDAGTIARFRLGFSPNNRTALKAALMADGIDEQQLLDAGLIIRPDGGGPTYDRFRGRVMFPITDPRGRVIAFGARILGDGQPKYLNSPDTPLFNKGHVLYGLATARPAARESNRVVVVEGYTDVIALARAGIGEAVAPLGTALTENQILLLWRLAPEPVLCFDGDAAGIRAAARAAERALPLLQPGRSLQFVTLAAGEDPDSLVSAGGAAAMEAVLAAAVPLDRVIWDMETAGKRLDTPERIAGAEHRLETLARTIADAKVQFQYRDAFRQHMRDFRWKARSGGGSGSRRNWPGRGAGAPMAMAMTAAIGPVGLQRRQKQILLAALINHTELLTDYAETLGTIDFHEPNLDKLRQEILFIYASTPDLDTEHLTRHLRGQGFRDHLAVVLGPDVYGHGGFARFGAETGEARAGIDEVFFSLGEPARRAQLEEAEQAYAENPTEETWARLQQIKEQSHLRSHSEDEQVAAEHQFVGGEGKYLSS
jgi:DNA primase